MNDVEYRMALELICPTPRNMYLNDSITADIGFARIIHLYFSGTMESGNMTGDAYITGMNTFFINPDDPLKDGFIFNKELI